MIKELEQDCSFEIFKNESQIPERFRGLLKPGEMLLKARSLTTDFLPSKWLKILAKDSDNQRVLWRHRDPESEKWRGKVYGRILESNVIKYECPKTGVEKEAIDTFYRIIGESKTEKHLQEFIKKRHELGEKIDISKGYILNTNKNDGVISRVFSLEDSITYKPQCDECVTQTITTLEEKKNMTNPKNPEKELKEIEKLQEELNAAKLQLEKKDGKVGTLEEQLKKFEKQIKEQTTEKVGLEDKVITLTDQINKFEGKFIALEKKPYLDELKKLEDPEIFELEKERDVKWLKERLEKKRAEASKTQVIVKSLEEEREEALKQEGEADIGTDSAFRNNPELLMKIKKLAKEGTI